MKLLNKLTVPIATLATYLLMGTITASNMGFSLKDAFIITIGSVFVFAILCFGLYIGAMIYITAREELWRKHDR